MALWERPDPPKVEPGNGRGVDWFRRLGILVEEKECSPGPGENLVDTDIGKRIRTHGGSNSQFEEMPMITEARPELKLEQTRKTKAVQYVFETKWEIEVEGAEQVITQLVSGKDFQAAFFKARTWAKANCFGNLVSMNRRDDFVL